MIVPDWLLYAWFALAGASTLYVAWDNFVRKNPEETVMKWGWFFITLYMGPIGLALYVLDDKQPARINHGALARLGRAQQHGRPRRNHPKPDPTRRLLQL
jgi:hypothetical protein